MLRPSFRYSLHATDADHLGFVDHPAPNVEPGDVVVLADGREAIVTARVETQPDDPIHSLLEVAMREEATEPVNGPGRAA